VAKYEKKFQAKAKDHIENQIKEEIFGTPRESGNQTTDGETKKKGFMKTAFSYKFLETKLKRFIFACILYVVADLNDESFEEIWKFRKTNSFFKVLVAAFIVRKIVAKLKF
jgi:hypothetical protein